MNFQHNKMKIKHDNQTLISAAPSHGLISRFTSIYHSLLILILKRHPCSFCCHTELVNQNFELALDKSCVFESFFDVGKSASPTMIKR